MYEDEEKRLHEEELIRLRAKRNFKNKKWADREEFLVWQIRKRTYPLQQQQVEENGSAVQTYVEYHLDDMSSTLASISNTLDEMKDDHKELLAPIARYFTHKINKKMKLCD